MTEAGGHSHPVDAGSDARRVTAALALILAFMAAEVVTGVLAHSLALLSDAAHMLTDAGALALSLITLRLVARPAAGNLTFGLKRMDALSAQANGLTLLVLAGLIVYEGVERLVSPPQPAGLAVLVVAVAGIAVNLLASRQLAKANRQSLNIEGSFQHVLTDLAAFIATAIAGAVILITGFHRADGIASLLIAAIMLKAAYGLLRDSGRVFLEAAPRGLDPDEIGQAMAAVADVVEVHDLHVWEVTSGFPVLSAHVDVADTLGAEQRNDLLDRLTRLLDTRFGIHHTTIQLECALCDTDGLFCALARRPAKTSELEATL